MKKIWKQRYQIMEMVGKGGNGSVYKVWDLHLEKEWVMKLLGGKDTDAEYKMLKKLSHPNLVRIVDAFEEEESQVIVMDYIRGVTLEEVIQKGPMEKSVILRIGEQICDALLYLHQSTPTLLYLDLKPSNILLEENGSVKLVDFGSMAVKGKSQRVSGTYGFASPEQLRVRREGRELNEQSDVFSFGMVLYAMTTGNCQRMPMVEEKNPCGILLKRKPGESRELLYQIIEKCTRGNRQKRYFGMREVKRDLELWKAGKKGKWKLSAWFRNRTGRYGFWVQEKSIFCSLGRHSFYIAKRMFVLLAAVTALLPVRVQGAEVKGMQTHRETEEKALHAILRDKNLRKVLLKEGCAYQTADGILIEIPWEEIEGKQCELEIFCKDEGEEEKRFFVKCIYKK